MNEPNNAERSGDTAGHVGHHLYLDAPPALRPDDPRDAPMVVGPNLNHLMLVQILPSLSLRRFLFRRGQIVAGQRRTVDIDGESCKPWHGTEFAAHGSLDGSRF